MGANSIKWNLSQWAHVLVEIILCVCYLWYGNQVVLYCGLRPASGHIVSGSLGKGSCAGQSQPQLVTSLSVPSRSFKIICSWSLLCWTWRCVGEAML